MERLTANTALHDGVHAHAGAIDPIQEAALAFRAVLTANPESARAVFQAIASMASTLGVREVLTYLADFCTRLTRSRAGFVYLWDPERELLVMRAAVKEFEQFVDRFTLSMGEGLAGWSALSKRPVIIKENAALDPRIKLVPEMGDHEFQSYLAYPIIAPASRLVGVLMLQALAPHEFGEDDLSVLNALSSIIAVTIDNAQLYEHQMRQVRILEELAVVSQAVAESKSPRQLLSTLVETAGRLTSAQHCVVLMADLQRNQAQTYSYWSRDDRTATGMPVTVPMDQRWSGLMGATSAHILVRKVRREVYDAIDTLVPNTHSALIAPMPMIDGASGIFICLYDSEARPGRQETRLVSILAVQAALAVQNAQLKDTAASINAVRDFVDSLMLGDEGEVGLANRGRRVGFDMRHPHVVAVFEMRAKKNPGELQPDAIWSAVRREIEASFPHSLCVVRENTFTALLRLSSPASYGRLQRRLRELIQRMPLLEDHVDIAGGLSSSCRTPADYRIAFEQARRTLTVGRLLHGSGALATFEELGAQWPLVSIAQQPVRDVYQEALERLTDYDRAKGTELFKTIEAYLHSLGNAKQTAEELYVHRNTLRQRLDKAARICGIDLADESLWFDVMLALRLIRLRELA